MSAEPEVGAETSVEAAAPNAKVADFSWTSRWQDVHDKNRAQNIRGRRFHARRHVGHTYVVVIENKTICIARQYAMIAKQNVFSCHIVV